MVWMLNNAMQIVLMILLTSFVAECKELFCYSCNSQFGSCDGNGCMTVSNGFCAYQQIIDTNGNIVRTIRSCLDMDIVPAGPLHALQSERCVETIDPNTNMKYRTYLCNSHNYCNVDCHSQLPTFMVNPSTPVGTDMLECFKCNDFENDCYSNRCTINNGYCLFQLLNVSVNGVRSLHYSKRCIEVPFTKTPNGYRITEINKCIFSIDSLGNRFYTLICNNANLCNANCNWISTASPIPVVPRSSSVRHTSEVIFFYCILAVLTNYS